tara:strand:+ start:29284 stop:29802 length:519 start_codon:yes stop_codon:yes gene_type:complete
MQSKAKTVKAYLDELSPDRRQAIEAVRRVIRKNLPQGIEEGMQYGMIGYFVPHRIYPGGYHCDPTQPLPFASLASQKNHMAIYLFCLYTMDEHREWFTQAWRASGKKLDMGKSCVRFKKIDDVPLAVVGQAIGRISTKKFIAMYEAAVPAAKRKPAKSKQKPAKKVARKKSK